MKKIILSATVAAMALTTTASALEDIKVSGQAKVWYETDNAGAVPTATDSTDLFDKTGSTGEVTFKVDMTGKQGNVGFGASIVQTGTMGLAGNLVSKTRSGAAATTPVDGDMFVNEMYITAPVGSQTLLKFGKQELQTPLAFTETWASVNNTFDAAVAINNSIDNLTLIAAFVGQGNGPVTSLSNVHAGTYAGNSGGTYAVAALYKNDMFSANLWAYDLESIAKAYWIDASTKVGPAKVTGIYASVNPDATGAKTTNAYALAAAGEVSGIKLSAAFSDVNDGATNVGNTATGSKKTKLPTMGVYTDGKFVAQPGSTAYKVKAAGSALGLGLALQYVNNDNDIAATKAALTSSEIDLIISKKLGDFNFKTILMDRDFSDSTVDKASGGQYVRIVASVNF
jgi:hypothetical protein